MQTSSNSIKLTRVATAGGLLSGVVLAVPWLWQLVADAGHAARRGGPLGPDEVLTAVTAGAALAGLACLALGVVLELLALAPGVVGHAARRVADVVTPALVRRLVGGALGVGVVAGLAPGAAVAGIPSSRLPVTSAVPSPGGGATAGSSTGTISLPDPALAPPPVPEPPPDVAAAPASGRTSSPLPDPGFVPPGVADRVPVPRPSTAADRGWVPAPPVVRTQPDVRVLTPSPRPLGRPEAPFEVVVHRGDTLWSLAARHLGPGATDAEIADAWPRWFAANRSVIGRDPDVLHPGQRLRPPDEVRS